MLGLFLLILGIVAIPIAIAVFKTKVLDRKKDKKVAKEYF